MLSHLQLDQNDVMLVDAQEYERTHMCFFYIGSDENMFNHLVHHFESGYREQHLPEAGKVMQDLYLINKKLPDVLFIDVPLNEPELIHFSSKLKANILLANLPVIYNQRQLTEQQINRLKQMHWVDDIISMDSGPINYFSKITFLKQSKLYTQLYAATKKPDSRNKFTVNLPFVGKRVIDFTIAALGIILLSPILLLIAVIIKLESRGPILYTSLRAGKGYRVFKFYKFRSMVANADKEVESLSQFNQYSISSNGPKFFKINNDPRITRFGKFLRNTSVDELPQLFNVLKGDMSLVGNRPLPLYEAVSLTTNEFVERFTAPAGITGLWQVNKRGNADMSSEERIHLDITYSRNCNFLYDLKIIAKTPVALFQKSDV